MATVANVDGGTSVPAEITFLKGLIEFQTERKSFSNLPDRGTGFKFYQKKGTRTKEPLSKSNQDHVLSLNGI